jgi:hypothetical protein
VELLPLLFLPFLLAAGVIWVIEKIVEVIVDWIAAARQRKRARVERELNRTQAELRATILFLAGELGADAHEARKALIRESYLASGRTPFE